MITIKNLAKEFNVSYEAIRQQIKRYSTELDGHIIKQSKVQLLDDYTVDFLKGKRADNPVVVYQQDKDEELENLRNENNNLLKKIGLLQEQLLESQKEASDSKLMLAENNSKQEKLELQNQTLKELYDNEKKRKLTFKERLLGHKGSDN